MPIKYQRQGPRAKYVDGANLVPGRFYRSASSDVVEPRVFIATDEGDVVALDGGVQYKRYVYGTFVEVNVEIYIGEDA